MKNFKKIADVLKLWIHNWILNLKTSSHCHPEVLSSQDTLNLIQDKKLSISRYGDGEFSMMLGRSTNIGFQVANSDLSSRLHEVFEKPHSNVLICIPKVFKWEDRKIMEPFACKYWTRYLKKQSRPFFDLMRSRNYYGNALISRPYMDYSKNNNNYQKCGLFFEKIKKLWEGKSILIVEGELTRFGVGNRLLDNAGVIKRVLCPAENCWASYSQILETTLSHAQDSDLVILALGPTATVLAHDLAAHGVWALDLGHLDIEYEWFLQRASRKTAVSGKYVNEAKNGSKVRQTVREDFLFESQVICKIAPPSTQN